jgi:2-polyprenyl-3-methyl-5-hydroxy-6-metoxy-1,4-benzoquinol methylase
MELERKWDALAKVYGTSGESANPIAADNVEIAWPAILKLLGGGKKRVLDFGCGAGNFCIRLHSLGHEPVGIDFSKKMITAARKASPKNTEYQIGSKSELMEMRNFDAITSIMVFQFIKGIESYLPLFRNALKPGGVIIFAVFNPLFAVRCYAERALFGSSHGNTGKSIDIFKPNNESDIPVFLRSEEDYRAIFESSGFEFVSTSLPPFSEEFVERYQWKLPYDVPEFLIMAFRRK